MSGLLMYEIGPEAMIVKPIVIADHSGTPDSGSGCSEAQVDLRQEERRHGHEDHGQDDGEPRVARAG